MTAKQTLSVFVPGAPKTKGSMEFVTRSYARESTSGSTRWRQIVANACRGVEMIPAGVRVTLMLMFYVPGDPIKTGAGDLDKLQRNILDALSDHDGRCVAGCKKHASVYADDNQVVAITASKQDAKFSPAGPGVVITVTAVG